MGRTLPTITELIHEETAALKRFRRALRREEQVSFDELFARVHHYRLAIGQAEHALPLESMLVAMLLETWGELRIVQRELHQLEQRIKKLEEEQR